MLDTAQTILDALWRHAWVLALPAIALVAFLVVRSKGKRIKGWVGEKAVRSLLDTGGFRHHHDVYLPTRKGVTQVDHVALVGGTIVVIETKNFEGSIYPQHGNIDWTQVMAGGKIKNRFHSPLVQNHGHIRAVRTVVGDGVHVEGLVVFAGGARFPAGMPEGVVGIAGLTKELRRIAAARPTSDGVVAGWEALSAVAAASDRKQDKAVHMETVAAAKRGAALRNGARAR